MQIMQHLSIFIVSVLLVSCADNEKSTPPITVENSESQLKAPTIAATEEVNKPDSALFADPQVAAVEIARLPDTHMPIVVEDSNTANKSVPTVPTLPTGRLNGVFGTSGDLQAYVSTENKTLKLKVGDQWEGWQVDSIAPDKLTISAGTNTHTLHLNQAIAPEASKQLALQNEYTEWSPPEGTSAEIKSPVHITQAQRETLQKRLLSIH